MNNFICLKYQTICYETASENYCWQLTENNCTNVYHKWPRDLPKKKEENGRNNQPREDASDENTPEKGSQQK
jgi:hypothetical protein